MYKAKEIIYIKALTPIHAGAGQGLESVDMPIQREKHSNIPIIEASSLKGSIKHWIYNKLKCENRDLNKDIEKENELFTIFGPEEGDSYASAIGFTDAKLLFFPIKSATDIFKLITCPYILKRWIEDLKLQSDLNKNNNIDNIVDKLYVSEGKCITFDNKVILEDYIFEEESNIDKELVNLLKKIDGLDINRVVILNDTEFIDLVTMYTEIITRNKIDVKTGTAESTGLFTEEYLPAETILYFTVLASPSFNEKRTETSEQVIAYFHNNVDEVFQIGGDSTIGKGLVKKSVKVGENNEQS